MRVLLYGSPDAPARLKVMAAYLEDGRLLPVVHYAKTAPEAREKALAWWDDQRAKALAKAQKAEEKRKPKEGAE